MFLTFDENDGHFDHVPPPAPPSFDIEGRSSGKSTLPLDGEYLSDPDCEHLDPEDTISGTVRPFGLSARVPIYVVSPWSKGGWVNSQEFDHTSLALFLEQRFDFTVPIVSPWHRAVCGDLTSAFNFTGSCDTQLPGLPDTSNWASLEEPQRSMPPYMVPERHQALFQERGTRPSRRLPYQLQVNAQVQPGEHADLTFLNHGHQGTVFQVYDRLHLDRIPRRYTVEAGKQLDDTRTLAADSGAYDLMV